MSQVTNDEIEDGMLCNDQTGSRLNDEGNGGSVGGVVLKKGPWTTAEDAILVDYVRKHGEGNWNAVQKHSDLSRCGKSCRLRWANHLRPNLKKGAFTAEEEQLIAELHAKMGNKWARMAAHLPGRTDNEIKNYWNTRIKRRQRARLPLYPPEVCLRALKESQCDQGTGGVNDDAREHHDFLPKNNYEMHDAIFDNLKKNQGILPTAPEHPNISANRIMLNSLASPPYINFKPSTLPNHNHFQESTLSFLSSSGTNGNWFYPFGHVQDHTSDKIAQSFGLHSPLDPGPSSHNSIYYRHSLSNGNSITSKPTSKAVKLELPSFQNPETEYGSWCTFPPPPMNESVFIQSPLSHGAPETGCSSPHNSGLLDAVLYQAKTRSCSKNNFSDKSSNSSATTTPVDRAESSALNMYETEREDYTDPASPFGATSILNECHAIGSSTTGNSWDKWKAAQNFSGNNVNYETVDQVCTSNNENQTVSLWNITWPDILLASEWLDQCHGHDKDQTCMTDASDDLTDYKNVAGGTYSSNTDG